MGKRGRKPGQKNGGAKIVDACIFCDGMRFHWGKECVGCDGTGSEKARRQLQKVYNAKNKLPINYNVGTK